jgi:hypothetical protein
MHANTDEHLGLERVRLAIMVAGSVLVMSALLVHEMQAAFAPVLTVLR